MEKQRKRMTACLVLAVIIIAIAAMVLMDIAATKITGVQLDVPDTSNVRTLIRLYRNSLMRRGHQAKNGWKKNWNASVCTIRLMTIWS